MAYNKHTWETQELITADKLNNIESGLVYLDNKPNILKNQNNVTAISNTKLANLSNLFGLTTYQEVIIDPNSGYRYLFSSIGDTKETEDLIILEIDQFLRFRSSMRVNHGVNRVSWLHGQFVQYNYYLLSDKEHVNFLIGESGGLVKLQYSADTTVNYDDLDIYVTVEETNSYQQAIDFDNNRLFSMYSTRPDSQNYTINITQYSLEPNSGGVSKVKSYSYTFDVSDGFVGQGFSAAPANDFIGYSNSTILFITSGGTSATTEGVYQQAKVKVFTVDDSGLNFYTDITNLDSVSYKSTSNTSRSDFIGYKDFNETIKEVEGSNVVKVNNTWVFTTSLVFGRDSITLNGQRYMQRNIEQLQVGFGNTESLSYLKNIGYSEYKNYYGVERSTGSLTDLYLPGKYQISPTLLPTLLDTPYILTGDKLDNIVGGSTDSVELIVEKVGMHQRIKQTLIVQPLSYTFNTGYEFSRYINYTFDFGKEKTFVAGRWVMKKITNIGGFTILPKLSTSKTAIIPGYTRMITSGTAPTFFAGDDIVFKDTGIFETLEFEPPVESNGTTARLIQRYTTHGTNVTVYERSITVTAYGFNATSFPQGIGGGYRNTTTVGNWTKLTN